MSLQNLRQKTFKMLERRVDYVAIQSFDALKKKILGKTRRETVEKIYQTLKNIKLTNEKLSIKRLDEVALKVRQAKEQAVKPEAVNEEIINSKNVNKLGIEYIHHRQIKKAFNQYPGSYIIHSATIYKNGKVRKVLKLDFISRLSQKKLNNRIMNTFFLGSGGDWKVKEYLMEAPVSPNDYAVVKTAVFKKMTNFDKQKRLLQTFKANVSNTCVYDGFLQYFKLKTDNTGKATYNRLIKKREILAKPYTLETIGEIAEVCKSSIIIKDLIHGNRDIVINKQPGNLYELQFINNRYNHLDLLTCTLDDTKIKEAEEYNKIKESSRWFIEAFGKLYTDTLTYEKNKTVFQQVYDSWKIRTNFDCLSIKSDSDLFKMLEGYDFNTHTFFNDFTIDDKLYKEIDLKKAYYNYSDNKLNKFYNGVPSGSFICYSGVNKNDVKFTIEDFNKQWDNKVVGFYEVRMNFDNEKLDRYGFKSGYKYLLFSSMVKLLSQWVDFEFINIAIAPSVHIPFDEHFLMKEDKVSFYCKAIGLMMKDDDYRCISIKPLDGDDKNFYDIIADENDSVYFNKETGLFKFVQDNFVYKSHKHIAYSIHAYTTTLVLDQLMKMNCDDVFGVKLDSIVFKKDSDINFDDCFDIKEANIERLLKNSGCDEVFDDGNQLLRPFKEPYYQSNNFEPVFTLTGDFIVDRCVLIGGPGGSGKTTSALTSKNFYTKQICYSANSWDLIQAQLSKYNNEFYGLSIPKLTGEMEGHKIDKVHYTNDIRYNFLDETTLLNSFISKKVNDLYYYNFVFYLGDVDSDGFIYQASIDKDNIISPLTMKCQYIKYTKTYRFDEALLERLNKLRTFMKTTDDISELFDYFSILFSDRFCKTTDVNFNDYDFGISSRNNIHHNSCKISKQFIERGAKPQYYIKYTKLEKGQLKGQRLLEKPEHCNYIETLFRTIHAFQGRELVDSNKIIIYLDGLFDFNLFYTAVSRAKRIDQINIINMLN